MICRFDANTAVDETLELGSSDTLRLEFVTKEGGNRGKAHQAFILIEDPATNLDISLPIPVKASGRTKLDLVCLLNYVAYTRNIVIFLLNFYMPTS